MTETAQVGVKIQNSEAHYQVILGNIKDATKELGILLTKKTQATTDLATLQTNISKAGKDLDALLLRHESEKKNIAQERSILTKDSDKFVADKAQHEKDIAKRHRDLDAKESKLNTDIVTLKETIANLKKLAEKAQAVLDKLTTEETNLRTSIETLSKEKRDLESDISTLSQASSAAKEQHEKDMEKYRIELADIQKQVDEERAKIVEPMKALDAREREMNKRESDYAVRKRRFLTEFQKLYPGQSLNI